MDMNHRMRKDIESEERMDPVRATRSLAAKEYLIGGKPNTLRIRGKATEMAADLSDSFSPDFLQYFTLCEASGEFDVCFSIIRHLYRLCDAPTPKTIRAFAANPEVWREYLRITAEQMNILHTFDPEGDPFP
jgi:hypothetical protein